MLIDTLEKGKLSHLVLQDALKPDPSGQTDHQERAFITRVFSGTLERLVYLDYHIDAVSSVRVRKMKPVIRNLLRMSLYQMWFMDSVPSYSCIDEAVKLARKRGFSNLTGFVNAVLRNLDRRQELPDLPEYVKLSVPLWIYELMTEQYGKQTTQDFFREIRKESKETFIRLCRISASEEEILQSLEEEGVSLRCVDSRTRCYAVSGFSGLTELTAFRKGWFVVQDPSSALCAETAVKNAAEIRLVLDTCAAPGGKSMYIAEHLPDSLVIARDLSESKIALIRENLKRTGIRNVTLQTFDASVFDPVMEEKADLVLADLPCSGLGVIRKKPDILYRLKKEDLDSLCALQKKILTAAKRYVKPGGILMYSTCTVNRSENQDMAQWILQDSAFRLLEEKQFLPGRDPFDGFYYAKFQKIRETDPVKV